MRTDLFKADIMTIGDDAFSSCLSIGYLVRHVRHLSQKALDPIFAKEGLTSAQWNALVTVGLGHCTCADIARELSYDKGAITRLIGALEEKGWLTRSSDESDRRRLMLVLTPAGEKIALRCRKEVINQWSEWLVNWDAYEVTQLVASLQKLRKTFLRHDLQQMVSFERSARSEF